VQVLGFGTYDREKHPRVGIVLDGLAEHGYSVSELNEVLGFSTAERVQMLGSSSPPYRLAVRMLRCWATLVRGRISLAGRGHPDVVVVGYMGHLDVVLARLLFPRSIIVLDLLIFAADTAFDRGVRPGLKTRLLAALDTLAVRCATLVMVDTEEHRALLSEANRHKAVIVPVGAEDAWFGDSGELGVAATESEEDDSSRPLRAVFFGLYTPLQGAPVIGEAIAGLDPVGRIEVVMVGSGQDLPETKSRAGGHPGVQWHTWMHPADLRRLVHASDVCLGIFGVTPKAGRVVPNKVYQGAAAGCVILTSDTAPQRRALGETALFVPPGNPQRLAEALNSLAADPVEVRRLRLAARRRADLCFRSSAVVLHLRDALEELDRSRKRT
jgi:glycosyltransferase involved in cell wall biosynthesis